jgi:lantibiotic modifying enzyme
VAPRGYYNLGVAHGVPGIVALLARTAIEAGNPRALRLLKETLPWLRAQRRPASAASTFASWIAPGQADDETPRPAWCYGDPGVGATLRLAAIALGDRALAAEARALIARAAHLPKTLTLIDEAGLCHGAAGLAQLLLRAGQAGNDPDLLRAARAWITRTLDLWSPRGFLAREPTYNGGQLVLKNGTPVLKFMPNTTFLLGSTGIALTLIAAATEIEPAWDRVLALS